MELNATFYFNLFTFHQLVLPLYKFYMAYFITMVLCPFCHYVGSESLNTNFIGVDWTTNKDPWHSL